MEAISERSQVTSRGATQREHFSSFSFGAFRGRLRTHLHIPAICSVPFFACVASVQSVDLGTLEPIAGPTGSVSIEGSLIAIADFNEDGLLDIVASSVSSSTVTGYFASDDESFTVAGCFAAQNPGVVLVRDFDNDGDPDIAVALPAELKIGIIQYQGEGVFSAPKLIDTVDPARELALVRSVVSGAPSLLTTGSTASETVLITDLFGDTLSTPVPLKFSEDYLQLALLHFGESTAPMLNGDATGDGVIDVADIELILANLGDDALAGGLFTPPCDDTPLTPPSCSPSPAFPGIQECIRAAACRNISCEWAACINYLFGGSYVTWHLQTRSCSVLQIIETLECFPGSVLTIIE